MGKLRSEITEHFVSSSLGERDLDGFVDKYKTITVKREGFFGVAIYNKYNKEIVESFENAELRSVIIEDRGKELPYLMLTSSLYSEKIKFAYICEDFVELGSDNSNRESILKDPYKWWSEWGTLIGDVKSNKTPYDVIAELYAYNYELDKGNSSISWEGAKSKNHDLESDDYNIEVKSTIAQFKEEVTVSNQFQFIHEQPLFLYFFIMQDSNEGTCIEELANILKKKGIDSDFIEYNLASIGYHKGSRVRNKRYKIMEARKYLIDDEFPMINSNSFKTEQIPKGVKKINYIVDLSIFDYELL